MAQTRYEVEFRVPKTDSFGRPAGMSSSMRTVVEAAGDAYAKRQVQALYSGAQVAWIRPLR